MEVGEEELIFVSRSEMPSVGGDRAAGSGRDEDADVRDSVSVVRRAGSVAATAILWVVTLQVLQKQNFIIVVFYGNFSRAKNAKLIDDEQLKISAQDFCCYKMSQRLRYAVRMGHSDYTL